MLLGELRAQIARVCGRLVADGLVVGTAGNVSARAGDLVAVTPSGTGRAPNRKLARNQKKRKLIALRLDRISRKGSAGWR